MNWACFGFGFSPCQTSLLLRTPLAMYSMPTDTRDTDQPMCPQRLEPLDASSWIILGLTEASMFTEVNDWIVWVGWLPSLTLPQAAGVDECTAPSDTPLMSTPAASAPSRPRALRNSINSPHRSLASTWRTKVNSHQGDTDVLLVNQCLSLQTMFQERVDTNGRRRLLLLIHIMWKKEDLKWIIWHNCSHNSLTKPSYETGNVPWPGTSSAVYSLCLGMTGCYISKRKITGARLRVLIYIYCIF